MVLDAGKGRIRVLADSVSGENRLPGSETATFSLCPHMAEGMKEFSGASFILFYFLAAQHTGS